MPLRKTPLVRGEYYHIYNRGHNRSQVVGFATEVLGNPQ